MQGRGLKLEGVEFKRDAKTSPLMQGRGLKPLKRSQHNHKGDVAPYAGAWIETSPNTGDAKLGLVAPYAGAWIETLVGPKPKRALRVAPYAGAWIETNQRD